MVELRFEHGSAGSEPMLSAIKPYYKSSVTSCKVSTCFGHSMLKVSFRKSRILRMVLSIAV